MSSTQSLLSCHLTLRMVGTGLFRGEDGTQESRGWESMSRQQTVEKNLPGNDLGIFRKSSSKNL